MVHTKQVEDNKLYLITRLTWTELLASTLAYHKSSKHFSPSHTYKKNLARFPVTECLQAHSVTMNRVNLEVYLLCSCVFLYMYINFVLYLFYDGDDIYIYAMVMVMVVVVMANWRWKWDGGGNRGGTVMVAAVI